MEKVVGAPGQGEEPRPGYPERHRCEHANVFSSREQVTEQTRACACPQWAAVFQSRRITQGFCSRPLALENQVKTAEGGNPVPKSPRTVSAQGRADSGRCKGLMNRRKGIPRVSQSSFPTQAVGSTEE